MDRFHFVIFFLLQIVKKEQNEKEAITYEQAKKKNQHDNMNFSV